MPAIGSLNDRCNGKYSLEQPPTNLDDIHRSSKVRHVRVLRKSPREDDSSANRWTGNVILRGGDVSVFSTIRLSLREVRLLVRGR